MTEYTTHMDIKFQDLERFDLKAMVDACTDQWYNQTLVEVNDSWVRLGVLRGEYHWHEHKEDEFFLVLDGKLLIDLPESTVELGPWQGITVPKGTQHRPRAPHRIVVVMLESAGVVPTGD